MLAVKWATNRPAAAVFVGQNKNRKWEKASGSYRCVFSHCSPSSGFFPPSFGPDLWRSVNSYRAVSLSPSSSLGPMSYFSAAAERGHASSAGRCLWRLKRRDVWHTPSDASILKFAKRAARGRCIFSESPSYVRYARVHPMNEREIKLNSEWKANFDDISPQNLLKNLLLNIRKSQELYSDITVSVKVRVNYVKLIQCDTPFGQQWILIFEILAYLGKCWHLTISQFMTAFTSCINIFITMYIGQF